MAKSLTALITESHISPDRHTKFPNDVYDEFLQSCKSAGLSILRQTGFGGLSVPYRNTNSADVRVAMSYDKASLPVLWSHGGIYSPERFSGFYAAVSDSTVIVCYPSWLTKKNFYGYTGVVLNVAWDGHEGMLRRLKADANNIRIRTTKDLYAVTEVATQWSISGYVLKMSKCVVFPTMHKLYPHVVNGEATYTVESETLDLTSFV